MTERHHRGVVSANRWKLPDRRDAHRESGPGDGALAAQSLDLSHECLRWADPDLRQVRRDLDGIRVASKLDVERHVAGSMMPSS